MGEDNSLLLRRAFEGAVVEAARRAAANYTLAVPQFYGGRIQLLLPLCLTGDKPELALTIQREDGFYAARHLPHARHGVQQRTTYMPPRDIVDKAVNGGLAAGFLLRTFAMAWLTPTNLKSRAKSSW